MVKALLELLAQVAEQRGTQIAQPPGLGATLLSDLSEDLEEGLDHYAVALRDPEGNEFDIN